MNENSKLKEIEDKMESKKNLEFKRLEEIENAIKKVKLRSQILPNSK